MAPTIRSIQMYCEVLIQLTNGLKRPDVLIA